MDDLISPSTLQSLRQTDSAPIVIDVRSHDEYAAGHVPDALQIPADELPSRLAEIPPDQMVVTY
jgi:rhodanese-related sulfurtransferase